MSWRSFYKNPQACQWFRQIQLSERLVSGRNIRREKLYHQNVCNLPILLIIWYNIKVAAKPWWRHQMGTFSALLAICAGNSPVPGEFPSQRPVTRSFDVFFDLRLNKRLNKQSWGWWFETLSRPLWRHCNALLSYRCRVRTVHCSIIVASYEKCDDVIITVTS